MDIADYEILYAKESDDLTVAVKQKIIDGWQPLGSPYFTNAHHRQAMVLLEPCDHEPSADDVDTLAALAYTLAVLVDGRPEYHECVEAVRKVMRRMR